MILEPINTQHTLQRTLTNQVNQNQKQESAGLHYLLEIPEK